MTATLQAKEINLVQLDELFGLVRSTDSQFFTEWKQSLPQLSEFEEQTIEEIKQDYLHLSRYEIPEAVVNLVVLSPVLKLAEFYRAPFYLSAEQKVELLTEDEGTSVRGLIDLLVFHPGLWVVTIESKRQYYSLAAAIPQALFYMLGNPNPERPQFGFITNGDTFQFLKLEKSDICRYQLSHIFGIDRENDLARVIQVLKHLGRVAIGVD